MASPPGPLGTSSRTADCALLGYLLEQAKGPDRVVYVDDGSADVVIRGPEVGRDVAFTFRFSEAKTADRRTNSETRSRRRALQSS